MTIFREQLQSARRVYRSTTYPGDLSAELLAPPTRWRGRTLALGAIGAGAIAAAAVLAAFLGRPLFTPGIANPQRYLPQVKEIQLPRKLQFAIPSLPSIRDFSPHLSFAPAMRSLFPPDGLHLPSLDSIHLPQFPGKSEHA